MLESHFQTLIGHYFVFVAGRHHELSVVDGTVAVEIYLFKHLVDLLFGDRYAEVLLISQQYLLLRQVAVSIQVNSLEYLAKLGFLVLLGQVVGNEG